MSSPRRLLLDALTPLLPGFRVVGFADLPDAISRPTVCAWTDMIERRDGLDSAAVDVTFEIWLLTGTERPEAAEDDLDVHMVSLYQAIEQIDWLNFVSAERSVLADRWHGWRIVATTPHITL